MSEKSTFELKYLYAGGVAGVVSRTLTAPLERLKILNQVQPLLENGTKYNSIGSGIKTIWQEEGFIGLFRGNGVNVLKAGPQSAIRFFSYEAFKNIISEDKKLTTTQQMWAGACAGVTSVTATYPLEVVKTHLSLPIGKYPEVKSTLHYLAVIQRHDGIIGLFRGLSAAIVNIAPFSAINFTAYEACKKYGTILYNKSLNNNNNNNNNNNSNSNSNNIYKQTITTTTTTTPPVYFSTIYGAISGAFSMTILYPLDVIKRRIMLQRIRVGAPRYKNFIHCAYVIIKDEGVSALYRGIKPAYAKVIPTVSLNFGIYEFALLLFPNK
ncbi:transmembrane protein [Heterostelium album PN500]|uniref:Transmembrane protein n=1 Tax=Heterostelium pallidum (strain ATCC 26659 / Pp 5 / PN500) TaxID=670386 RepID=D3BDG1_HETP5|nr:transmembrane protein [Heterostelium album PN500]EFA80605.1 transmembrane protein [Heterostelium album PN500]|eukprot:XP_020432725.1 transmembrane protein [Heterostelium album PN500]